jgi:CRP-like cAMP-binding protein
MDSGERTATVSAVGAVVAVRIGRTRFQEFAARHPDADHRIALSVLGKMRTAIRRRAEARTWDARARLAAVLHELATDYGEPVPEGTMIGMSLSQFELGGLAAVAESTAERVLKGLRQDGLVLTRYRRIVVCDLAALAAIRDGARKP